MKNYNKQAVDFLAKYNLSLNVGEAVPQKSPLWITKTTEDHGINYYCTLSNKDGKHYSFDFWGSLSDKYSGKKPTAYDVLSCLDTFADGYSFEDFCNNYGYSTNSIIAEKTYKAVIRQVNGLKAVLTPKAREELNNIQ